MLAAISTTILLRRSCALTGSAITSRSRRNSTRGPPSAPRIAMSSSRRFGPGGAPPDRLWCPRAVPADRYPVLANAVRRGQDKRASPRVACRDAAAGCAECIGIDDLAINVANGFGVRVLRCGRAEALSDGRDVGVGRGAIEIRDGVGEQIEQPRAVHQRQSRELLIGEATIG